MMIIMCHLRDLLVVLCMCAVRSMQVYAPELEQLEGFIELSRSNFDGDYLKRTSGCIQNHILQYGDRGSPRRPCKKMAATVVKDMGIVRTTSSADNTCKYFITASKLVHSFPSTLSTLVAEIRIEQSNCTEGWTSAIGKSSLRVHLDQALPHNSSEEHVATSECHLTGINAAVYTYHCPLHSPIVTSDAPGRECNALCGLNVTAVLDYEHYSAFDEVVGLTYGLNKVAISQPLPMLLLQETGEKNKKRKVVKGVKARCCGVMHSSSGMEQSPLLPQPSPHKDLSVMQNTTALRTALDRFDAVYFVGASHMRYLWDTVVHAHYNASALLAALPQHHADEKVENLWFVNNYFSMELPALLKDICAPDSPFAPPTTTSTNTNTDTSTNPTTTNKEPKGKVVFVIQTGSWDLDFNPAQNILLFPNSSTAVVQTLINMTRIDNNIIGNAPLCNGRVVEIVWLTSVPIPECEDTVHSADTKTGTTIAPHTGSDSGDRTHRKRKDGSNDGKREKTCFDKGYRNNYAIKAINQYFVREVEKAMYITNNAIPSAGRKKDHRYRNLTTLVSMQRFHIIDAFDMIYPHRNDNVCGLHYLCCKHYRKERVEMLFSPGGEKVVHSVLNELVMLSATNG